MLSSEFRAEVNCIAGIVDVDLHRSVRKCERKDEGVLSPAIVRCVRVMWMVSPWDVRAVGVHDCCRDPDFDALVDAESFLAGLAVDMEDRGRSVGCDRILDWCVLVSLGIAPGPKFNHSRVS